ncbi:winged helix DNA-binding domain-containing protein [Saccharomonospora azurea]|uniref:winged helix DNA-binding domain-containing protein n=1 Tax=Saccharomonospora azurea TaxID=40988 RepID=UPI0033199245
MRLSTRRLGRAVLARQLLSQREALPVVDAVEHVFGLNAQNPNPPYLALWNRVAGFARDELTAAVNDGTLVRSTLLRGTQHLMSVPDFQLVRPLVAPLLRRVQRNAFGRRTAEVDLGELVARARRLLADGGVLTRPELGRQLATRWPDVEPGALATSVQYLLPVVHPAPSGTWNVHGPTPFALADGVPTEATAADAQRFVLRYLRAFGPASVADARTWSGVGGLAEVFETLRPRLVRHTDESGRELFDVEGAPLPDEDADAPVRLLPEFDATLLAHADRTRVMTDEVRQRVCHGAAVAATVLLDGTVAASWTRTSTSGTAGIDLCPFRALTGTQRSAVESEALRLLAFTDPGSEHRITWSPTE